MNLSDLGRELGVAANTVKSWVSILDASRQIYLCPAYYESLGKRLIKSPRLHLVDPGLLCRLTGTSTVEQVLRGPMAGAIFESLVGGELLRLMTDAGDLPQLYHWRTVKGEEVDFVLEIEGRTHGLECKLTSSPTPNHANSLQRFLDLLPAAKRGQGMIVCTHPRTMRFGTVRTLPIGRLGELACLPDLLE